MPWRIYDSGVASAEENMAIDQALLRDIGKCEEAIIHLYEWSGDSATYGYFTNPFTFLDERAVNQHRLQLARRPTGGGIIFHLCDFAFSILIPATHPAYSINTLDNYLYVNKMVAEVVRQFGNFSEMPELLPKEEVAIDKSSGHFCMAKPTKFDVMIEGKKVAGGAQRRTKQGFLHQGSLSLTMPSEVFLQEVLLSETCVQKSIQKFTHPLIKGKCSSNQLLEAKNELRNLMVNVARKS